jgi:hypothetical protein
MTAVLDEGIMGEAGADVDQYKAAMEELKAAGEAHYAAVTAFNVEYAQLKNSEGDEEELAAMRAEAAVMNENTLKAFKFAQDNLLNLMYERPVVPHEAYQENIQLINEILPLLEEGDVVTAADEYAWAVNNVLEWYHMYFSPEVTKHTTDYFYPEYNAGNLFWGTDKMLPSWPMWRKPPGC